MGLDAVEFVLALEEAFGISITDEESSQMFTPRHVVDYLERRLPPGNTDACFSQRAFFRLRSTVVKAYRIPRRDVRPDTNWDAILPHFGLLSDPWRQLQNAAGLPDWPRQQLLGFRLPAARTVGATAKYLAHKTPHLFKSNTEGWSRREIERIVRDLMRNELLIEDFEWDDHFVKDLGLN